MKRIGLVLSGGGVRGVAHAGVLRFLDEKKIYPDVISATSAGAVVAGLYAFGKKPDEILNFFQSIDFFSLKHLAFSRLGIVNSSVFRPYLESVFKKAKIKDAKIPIFITATDISSGRLHVFDGERYITDAIIASSSVPGVVTPYVLDGVSYCDGGIINNFPVDLLLDEADKIIGVYLSPALMVQNVKLGSMKMVATRAIELLLHRSEIHKFDHCDKVICPTKLNFYGHFENRKKKIDEIFHIGYDEASKTFSSGDF